MNFSEITQDDLFDLGFEPLVTENTKSMDFEHKELGIKLWKGMYNPDPQSRFWKMGYGKEKVQFESLEQLTAYMESLKA
ncbi:hypothetical protein CJD36_022235 [Flavipsychrobacter stenotrophus]|uniref:Uncharacterized protein n=1 Tax=Flavipsychrobacter stenotrophus TaxID=2077091 RepID=A0A2S7SQ32_9BACT|nr:hypothetical protein [Flavipsychrobacter stenotrophus]PQJ08864.1 hypothetical protein CJD36_022235 [Flavipsychrobacter stenotrophus]